MEPWYFKKEIKLYIIEDGSVAVGFRVSDTAVVNATFTIEEFQYIVDHWVFGVEKMESKQSGRVWWSYRDRGPRPECVPMEFVAISIRGYQFRISVAGMKDAVEQFEDQLYRYKNGLPPVG